MHNQSSIVKFWRAVEHFEPQQIPKLAPNDEEEPVVKVAYDESLPWEIERRYKGDQEERRFHRVFGGVFKMTRLKALFGEIFDDDGAPDLSGRDNNESASFTFTINEKGQPLIETFAHASCAWALGKTLRFGHESKDWLNGFEFPQTEIAEKFAERVAKLARFQQDEYPAEFADFKPNEETEGASKVILPILSFDDLVSEIRFICEKLGIEEVFEPIEIRVKSFQKFSDSTEIELPDFLNSFYSSDLERVAGQIEKGNVGTGLKQYLTAERDLKNIKRIDLRQSVETLFDGLSPQSFPRGRWAANGLFPLVFSQQFAVNAAFEKVADGGLFSVNGPPGTSKTTMLRDVVAAVIVENAEQLAAFDNPERAFGENKILLENLKNFRHSIVPIDKKLKDFGIVVASSNNGAVENISMALPVEDAIDAAWRAECEYFAEAATYLISKEDKKKKGKTENIPAWGLISAKLGNAENKNDFKKNSGLKPTGRVLNRY